MNHWHEVFAEPYVIQNKEDLSIEPSSGLYWIEGIESSTC